MDFNPVNCRPNHHHTSTVYGPFSGTTRVSRCQKRNFWTLW